MTRYPPNELLREARLGRGWSSDRLADLLTDAAAEMGGRFRGVRVAPRTVRRWEAGDRQPWPVHAQLLCRVFDATPAELGLVKRREFLKLGAATGLALMVDGPGVLSRLLVPGVPSGPRQQVDQLAQVTDQLGSWYWRMAPSTILPLASSHQANLLNQLRAGPHGHDRGLLVLAAQSSVVMALASYRQGDHAEARRHVDLAAHLARQADDGPALALALTTARALVTSVGSGGARASADEAIHILDAAERAAGPDALPLLRVWLLCSRAEEMATLSRDHEMLRDLDRADAIFANSGPAPTGFFDHWDQDRVDGWRASALLLLGRHSEAARILDRVSRATPVTLPGPWSAVVADQGAAHSLAGEPERGAQLLMEAFGVAQRSGVDDSIARVLRIRRRYLARYGELPAVRQLDDLLGDTV